MALCPQCPGAFSFHWGRSYPKSERRYRPKRHWFFHAHCLGQRDRKELPATLLDYGADHRIKDSKGHSALWHAYMVSSTIRRHHSPYPRASLPLIFDVFYCSAIEPLCSVGFRSYCNLRPQLKSGTVKRKASRTCIGWQPVFLCSCCTSLTAVYSIKFKFTFSNSSIVIICSTDV